MQSNEAVAGRRVLVVGAGVAGLTAAIAAREAGAEVIVVEKGAECDAGGNASFSGGAYMFCYEGPEDILALADQPLEALGAQRLEAPPYRVEDYVAELVGMSDGQVDLTLARTLAEQSQDTMKWLVRCGVPFEILQAAANPTDGVLRVLPGQALRVFGEGYTRGLYLVNPLLARARELGVELRFSAPLTELLLQDGHVVGGRVQTSRMESEDLFADAVIVASGGFQASQELRLRHLGPVWEHARLRGTRHSDGSGILAGMRAGAATSGNWSTCHSAAVHADTPSPLKNDDASPPGMHGFWLGVMLNREGKRFVDEGGGLWSKTYSKMGKAIMEQPGAEAVQVFDQRTAPIVLSHFTPTVPATTASTPWELAMKFGLPPAAVEQTLTEFSEAVNQLDFDASKLDGKGTAGIDPPKSNWANPLDTAPFTGFRAVAGLTFTFAGLSIDGGCHVLDNLDTPIPGLFGAGESCGGLFYNDYPAGAALMRSSVFGRIAGTNAAAG